ncbi:MAG TPA: hypothetical protein VGL38_02775 [bacterium]|jgi:hypothetical protein
MSSKYAFGWLIVLALCVALFPRVASCAEWNVSPFRAQLASADPAGQTEAQAVTDSSTSVMSNPLKKNIGKAALFSLIIPGSGELYSGQWWRAIPFFALEVGSWAVFATYHGKGNKKTDEFQAYAGWRDTPNNFDTRAYLYAEYLIASDSIKNGGRPTYHGNFEDYGSLPWDERYQSLPAPFTHDVNTTDQQQFYEMIGKYFLQFGWGWKDTYNSGIGWTDAGRANWADPAAGQTPDNTATIAFDGGSAMFFHYRDMRGLANSYYNKGNTAMEIVLANHILSALDAAFAVRSANKRLEKNSGTSNMGQLHFHYDAKQVNGSLARYVTVTVPLN